MGKDLENIEIRGKVNVESIFQTFKVWNGPNWGGSRLWKGSWFFCVKFKHLGIEQQRQARRRQQTLFWDVWTSKPVLAPGSGTAPGQQPRVPGPPIPGFSTISTFLLFYFLLLLLQAHLSGASLLLCFSSFLLLYFHTFLLFYFSVFLLFYFSTFILFRFSTFLCFYFSAFLLLFYLILNLVVQIQLFNCYALSCTT